MSQGELDFDRLLEREAVRFDEELLRARFAGRAAMVVGAGGSIGGALVELLLARGAALVVCAEAHEPSLFRLGLRLRERAANPAVRLALADLRDTPRLERLIAEHGVDAVFQLAAYKHVPLSEENADQVVWVNVLATLDLADAATRSGVAAFVYPSTDKAVRPPSIYGATKRVVELELLRRAAEGGPCRFPVVRLVNVFGTAGTVIEVFARQIGEGRPLSVTDRRMTRYWMTRREAILLLASAAGLTGPTGPLLLDVGDPVPLVRTAERLAELLERPNPRVEIIGLRPGERLHEELTYPYEELAPTGLSGVREARARRPLEDVRGTVDRLRASVQAGDTARVRRLLTEAVDAMVAV
ncbi:MAG TPA: polysaccharide biosynthesis protein [Chloroflexota bacterium]|nr:polysaccharide biosynthesis protein [Chloroflexota bacterium]